MTFDSDKDYRKMKWHKKKSFRVKKNKDYSQSKEEIDYLNDHFNYILLQEETEQQ